MQAQLRKLPHVFCALLAPVQMLSQKLLIACQHVFSSMSFWHQHPDYLDFLSQDNKVHSTVSSTCCARELLGYVVSDYPQSSSIIKVVLLFLPHALLLLQSYCKPAQAPHAQVVPFHHPHVQAAAVSKDIWCCLPHAASLQPVLTHKK